MAPYPGVELTAKLSDPDMAVSGSDEVAVVQVDEQERLLHRHRGRRSGYAYTPTSDDVGYYLRATVSYKDGEGDGKSAMATSAHEVQAINSPNATPAFPDEERRHGGNPE